MIGKQRVSNWSGACGGPVVSVLEPGTPIKRFGAQIPARAEICIEISAPSAPHSQYSYDEYTVNGKMRREGRGLATRPHNAEAKKMKSLAHHTYGCLRDSTRDCSFSSY